jgi:hypothetical protein
MRSTWPIRRAVPSGHGPSAHVLGSHAAGLLTAVGDMYANPFTSRWPGYDPAHIGYVFTLTVQPGQTVSLMTFVAKGLSEVYDPRGGFPIPLRDALVAPKYSAPYSGAAPKIPEPGSEIARVTRIARHLVEEPDLRGLTPLQRAQIVNWRVARPLVHDIVHRRGEDGPSDRGCPGTRRDDIGGCRTRIPGAPDAIRPPRAGAAFHARAECDGRCRSASPRC